MKEGEICVSESRKIESYNKEAFRILGLRTGGGSDSSREEIGPSTGGLR